ncbi:hypothetical protein [Rhizobium mesosinicum]|uniref:Uncharacterized protein n=1 Tax=Rhizobium mesosinicum TaxID=335017 RepID=A0ABS7H074_9HYPH|nr:hypothetical protein [Rhizobium mesosinicum]MBW9054943.1 hypothetical protein [Rhizobium mesosinicum]
MAKKNRIPKKIAGYKIPKAIRKSATIRGLLASDIGRGILANALTAAAGAAATVLLAESDEISDAAGKGARKGKRALGIAGSAMSSAADAAIDVIKDSARDALPKKMRKDIKDRPQRGAMH